MPQPPAGNLSAHLKMTVAGTPLDIHIDVPSIPVPPRKILPALRILTDTVVAGAETAADAEGRCVSCRKGCGACCRQLVPISGIEAHVLRDLVTALPEPRRTEVLNRFSHAVQRIDESGLSDSIDRMTLIDRESRNRLGLDYFRLGIPCPFLEDESCSIHPDRPLSCREYLVTSPAVHCADPTPETIRVVEVPRPLSPLLAGLSRDIDPDGGGVLPLTLALKWADTHPEPSPTLTGPDWLREIFRRWLGFEPPPA